MDNYHHFLDDF